MDLVLAIDTSGSMRGEPIEFVQRGLLRMIDGLEPGDRVAIVGYSEQAYTLLPEAAGEDAMAIEAAINQLRARGTTNIYDGLYTAFDIAAEWRTPGRQSRVILLSDGVATAGLTQGERLKSLAQAYAREGIGITTIGVGVEFDVDVMRALSEVGAGNFYFLENPAAVEEVFADEIATFLVPVALDVEIEMGVGGGYRIGQAYGTNGWRGGLTGGVIEVPSLFLAGRQSAADPIEDGRRGGGGGILIELLPLGDQSGVENPTRVGHLSMRWTDPETGERLEQVTEINSPDAPGVIPAGGFFTDATVEKGFVMLNLLVGFQMAADLAYDADFGTAIGVLEALKPEVQSWLSSVEGDPDIEDDLRYVDMFIDNLRTQGTRVRGSEPPVVVTPPDPWPVD
jgi:Ca-activated chloride channel family protein